MITEVFSRVLGKMYLFIVPYAPVTDSFSKRENAATILTMWLAHIFLYILVALDKSNIFNMFDWYKKVWPYESSDFRSLYNPNVHIGIVFTIISAIIAYKVSGKYVGLINENNSSHVKYITFILCFIALVAVGLMLKESTIGFVTQGLFHLTTFIYFYNTKSTFGLKLDEQSALDNQKGSVN